MPDTPLNPDALEAAARATYEMRNPESWAHTWEELEPEEREEEWVKPTRTSTLAYLAVAQPEVNSVEELDALPINSVILDRFDYLHHKYAKSMPDFKNLVTGGHITRLEFYLPARVLHRPEVNDA